MFLAIGAAAAAMLLQGPYGGYGGVQQTPGGDYQRSCREVRINGGQMTATCNDRSNRPRQTTIPLLPCAGYPIGNDDGVLVCGRVRGDESGGGYPGGPGGGGYPGGPGGGRGSITVYEDIDYRGASISFDGPVNDLSQTRFNDRISSLRLRGSWQVCTDAYFQGRCFIYNNDERDVGRDRLNDQISSMRPVGRDGRP